MMALRDKRPATDLPSLRGLRQLWDESVPKESAADSSFETLREAILRGILPAGMRLSEEEIAALFSVSRTPVREAMLRLESELFIERTDRRGMIVTRVSEDEVLDVYIVREVLEGLAAKLAARHATLSDLIALRLLNEELVKAVRSRDVPAMAKIGLDFHIALVRASHNVLLVHLAGQGYDRIRRFGGTTLEDADRAPRALEEHDKIIRAIEARDGGEAETIAQEHMSHSLATRLSMLIRPSSRESDG